MPTAPYPLDLPLRHLPYPLPSPPNARTSSEGRSLLVGRLPGSFATVSKYDGNINDGLTVVFEGGDIRLKDWTGKVNDHFGLTCPNLDVITMILVAQ